MDRKIILITGASKGLGLALARRLIFDDSFFLILTARNASQYRFADASISEAKNIWIRDLEITDHEQVLLLVKEANDALGGVDILINNAGVTDRSTVEESSSVYRRKQLEVNYLAPFDIISLSLSSMRQKKWGKIINVSSAGGFMAMPTMSAYSASKFALEGATESLWYEMRPFGINVTLVVPGFINSEGFSNTSESEKCQESLQDKESTYYEHYSGMKRLISKNMRGSMATNEKIALKIIEIVNNKNPPLRVYVTFDAWLFYMIRKLCPPSLYLYISYRLLPNIRKWGKSEYRV